MSRPVQGETLFVYLSASSIVVSSVVVREEKGIQLLVFFVSRILRDVETRYPPMEKLAFALVITAQKLRPYFQAHPIWVLTKEPLKRVIGKFEVSGRLLNWVVEISEFDITFAQRTAMKAQVLSDFVVEIPALPSDAQHVDRDSWIVYVDGASFVKGIGVTMVSPTGEVLNYALQLLFFTSNNTAEYEAMLAGLRLAKWVGAKWVDAKRVLLYSDFQLAVNKILGVYEVRDQKLEKYLEELQRLCGEFEHIEILHVPRDRNRKDDVLSKLTVEGNLDKDRPIILLEMQKPSIDVEYSEQLLVEEANEWYMPVWDFLTRGNLPTDSTEAARIRRWSARFTITEGSLYKRGFSYPWLKCIRKLQARGII